MRTFEPNRAGEALVYEVHPNYCRENLVIANTGVDGIEPGTVLLDDAGDFKAVLIWGADAELTDEPVAGVVRGPAEVRGPKLVFPTVVVTNAVDGPDAGTDTTAENAAASAAATAAKQAALVLQMNAKGILVR